MDYYVYIIRSLLDQSYYKGSSLNPWVRLEQHNRGETQSTRAGCPWELVYLEKFLTKREALIREKALKKWSRLQLEKLIGSTPVLNSIRILNLRCEMAVWFNNRQTAIR